MRPYIRDMTDTRDASVQDLFDIMWDLGATDLLLTVGAPPLARVMGELKPLVNMERLLAVDTERMTNELLTPEDQTHFEKGREVDFSFSWKGRARFRGNAFHQRGCVALSLRLIPFEIPSFADLGTPPAVERLVQAPHGLILVTGPTGAGKSTTIASMIDWINQHRSCHILTLEDPIEYLHHHKQSAVNQREIGTDSESWAHAFRSALRQDPDVILVGEMRDTESIATALTIAETGHLVFATLHTNDTSQALDRIIDVFPSDRRDQIQVQLAATLRGVIYQRLFPRIQGGMVAAYEVLLANNAIRNLIREGKTRQMRNVIATSRNEGMVTLETWLSKLVMEGIIDHDEAALGSLFPKEIERLPGGRPQPSAVVGAGRNGNG